MSTVQTNTYEGRVMTLTVTEKSQDIPGNTTVLSWVLTVSGGQSSYYDAAPTKAVVAGKTVYETSAVTAWNTYTFPAARGSVGGEVTVVHDSDGTKALEISLSSRIYYHTPETAAATMTLTPIPRAAAVSAESALLGQVCKVTVTPPSEGVSTRLFWQFGDLSGEIPASGLWQTELAWASQIPNSVSGQASINCQTISSGVVIGTSSCLATLRVPDSVMPIPGILEAAPVSDCVPEDWGILVQGKSRVKLTLTGAEGAYGSTIRSYAITGGGFSAAKKTLTTGILENSGQVLFRAQVTDSRGRTAIVQLPLTVYPYSPPALQNVQLYRCDAEGAPSDTGAHLYVKADCRSASIGGRNVLSMKVQLMSQTGALLSSAVLTPGVGKCIGGAMEETCSYYGSIQAIDSLAQEDLAVKTIPTAHITFMVRRGGKGAAFGEYPSEDNVLSIASDWLFKAKGGLHTHRITGLESPAEPTDGVNKAYLDSLMVESTEYPGCFYRVAGDQIEWIQPPMLAETEYATAERFDGRTVYRKRLFLSNLPSGTTLWRTDAFPQGAQVVALRGVARMGDQTLAIPNGQVRLWTDCASGGIAVYAQGDYTAYQGDITIHYTR